MKHLSIILLVIAFFGALYFGFIFVVGKSMDSQPTVDVSETTAAWEKQSRKTADLQQQQRDLMQQRKDRMRDMQRR